MVLWGGQFIIGEALLYALGLNLHPESLKQILQENSFNLKISGNEVYHKNSLMLLVKNILCSKLHCQKGFSLNNIKEFV